MSEARNDSAEARVHADAAEGAAAGRHRGAGPAGPNPNSAHGRHRRPAAEQ
jgi:hypothetical protein